MLLIDIYCINRGKCCIGFFFENIYEIIYKINYDQFFFKKIPKDTKKAIKCWHLTNNDR